MLLLCFDNKLLMIISIVGHVAEEDAGGWCHMVVFVEVAAPAAELFK